MKGYFEQLKPQERRWAVGIGLIVFLMLNWFFVRPHFHAWGRDQQRMVQAQTTNNMYNAEVRHKAEYQRRINELETAGDDIPPAEQAIDFVHFFTSRAINNRVLIMNQGALVTRTNEFFLEQQMGITLQADETNLVNFLYSLGAGNSMMRVRAMSLHPDPGHHELNASLTLVASYRKKAAVAGRPGTAAAATTPPVKPPVVAPKPQPIVAPPATPAPQPAFRVPAQPVVAPTNRPSPSLRPPPNSVTNKHGVITH